MRFRPLRKLLRSITGSRRHRKASANAKAWSVNSALWNFINSCQIANVIDVGANAGQFARVLRTKLAYQGRIISIEPLPDAFARLQARAAADERWSVLNVALGDSDTTLPINISGNSVSSSLLPILERCVQSAPSTAYVGQATVQVRRLDSVPELRAAAAERCLLKIDAQGYEYRVLQGAEDVLGALSLLYLESSLVPLYEGELLIEEMIAYLRRKGFSPVDISRGFSDRITRQQLQADILFARV